MLRERSVQPAGPTLFMLWLFLLSPVVFNGVRQGWPGGVDGLFLFNIGTSLLWIVVLHFGIRWQAVLHVLLLPLYVATGFDLFLQSAFGARLTSGYLGLAITDRAETLEFLSAYRWALALPLGVALLAYAVAIVRLPRCQHSPRPRLAVVASVCLAVAYGAVVARNLEAGNSIEQSVLDLAGKELSAPMGTVFQGALALKIHADGEQLASARKDHSFGATQAPGDSWPEVVVWVIGESSRPQNWSLFGYARETTPLLSRRTDLLLLRDMQTTAPHTSVAVPSMLSLRPVTDWGGIVAARSVVSAFAEAGYKTHWASTQQVDAWGGIVPQLAAEAGRTRYYERSFDGVLLEDLKTALASARATERHFFVLHTKGSHFEFARRYPPEFARYKPSSSNRRDVLVSAYDNSILYTDWFLSGVIEAVEATGRRSLVVFASDHGENLLDDDRGLFGHAIGNEYDLRTASLFWFSPALAASQAEALRLARAAAAKPLDLSCLPHSVLHLAGVQTPQVDIRKSVFSPLFQPPVKRPFLVRGELKGQ